MNWLHPRTLLIVVGSAVLLIVHGLLFLSFLIDLSLTDVGHEKFSGKDMLAARNQIPEWSRIANAIGICGGFLAAVLIVVRSKFALPIIAVSLLFSLISLIQNYSMSALRKLGMNWFDFPVFLVLVLFVEFIMLRFYLKLPERDLS